MAAHEPNPLREARVGLVTLCLVLGVSMLLIVLCNVNWGERRVYRVGFRVNQDATGIEPGTPVTLGGLTWGRVLEVTNGEIAADGRVDVAQLRARPGATRGTLVEFELDTRIELHDGAKVARSATILGGNVQLVVVDTGLMRAGPGGLPTKSRGTLGEGAVVAATEINTGLSTLVGPRAASNIDNIPRQFDAVMKSWNDDIRPGLTAQLEGIQASYAAIDSAIRTDKPGWTSNVDRATASIERLKAQFDTETPQARTVMADLRRGWSQGSGDLDAVKADYAALKRRFDDDFTPRAERLYEQATSEWDRTKRLLDQVTRAGADSIATYQDFMANSSLMGDQVKLALGDLPRAVFSWMQIGRAHV